MSDETAAETAAEPTAEGTKAKKGWEDRGGFGFLGLTGGLVGAFIISFYAVAPTMLTPKPVPIFQQTLAAIVTLVLMIGMGGVGYYFTKKPAPRSKTSAS